MNVNDICDKSKVTREVTSFFTSEDIIKLNEYFTLNKNTYSIEGLIQFFEAKVGCNRVASILNELINNGVKIMPNIVFHPVTEKRTIKDGCFTITQQPYYMGDSIFINNLIVVKLFDGTYDFYDDVEIDLVGLKCNLKNEKLSGTATVSYFVLDTAAIGGLN